MIHLAKNQYCESETATTEGVRPYNVNKIIFSCLDGENNDEGKWFRGVRKNILRFVFQVQHKKGDTLDFFVSPVYKNPVEDACM